MQHDSNVSNPLKNAINSESFKDRINDVRATIDQLEKLSLTRGQFCGRLDLDRLGMCGHSYGAITTQAVSGQSYGLQGQAYTDSRIKAAIALSPSMPSLGGTSKTFAMVKIPWLLMTGTDDNSPVNRRVDAKSRREVFKSLPSSGHCFEMVLNKARTSYSADAATGYPPLKNRSSNRTPSRPSALRSGMLT